MPFTYDHTTNDLSIYKMVRNRLPFVTDNAANTGIISNFTLEMMHKLEVCLNKDKDSPDPSHIGQEEYYTVQEQSLIADIVTVYLIYRNAVVRIEGDTDNSVSAIDTTFVKKAGAGSAQVEFGQLDTAKAFNVNLSHVAETYKSSAIAAGLKLGCTLIFLDNGGLEVSCISCEKDLPPFIVNVPL